MTRKAAVLEQGDRPIIDKKFSARRDLHYFCGLRRQATDLAPEFASDARVLNRLSGHLDSATRDWGKENRPARARAAPPRPASACGSISGSQTGRISTTPREQTYPRTYPTRQGQAKAPAA